MIRRLSSSIKSFKTLEFNAGMNVVLAQKSAGATERQSRNGSGKSSFVEIVHFLLGGSADTKHFLRAEPFDDESFAMLFDLAGSPVEVERHPKRANDVIVLSDDTEAWPVRPKVKAGQARISNVDWRSVLGSLVFGLSSDDDDDVRFGPTFRSLISYFARRQNSGGFATPQQQSAKQQGWDQQVAVSYLLGLDADVPRELQEVRTRVKALSEFRKAAKEGAFGELVGKAADLQTRLTLQDARVEKLRQELVTFRVVPEYQAMEREAGELSNQIAALSNDNTLDATLIDQLNEAVLAEAPPRFADVEKAYVEAGIALPGLVKKRFAEVETFHRSIVSNRQSHLQWEMVDARARIQLRTQQQEALDARRAQLMVMLQSGGALEHFARLQSELSRLEAQAESLRKRLEAARALESKGADLDLEKARIHRRLMDDHREQARAIEQAILVFESLSSELYERAGSLRVDDTDNGPTFDVTITGSRSKGINNMQIFCFDMMLMELCQRRGRSPGFLIHDSHLFDGVDERQIARALEIGADRAEKLGFQYIVTLNEDAVPHRAFGPGFNFAKYVNPVRLTDATDDGGLFGMRFE